MKRRVAAVLFALTAVIGLATLARAQDSQSAMDKALAAENTRKSAANEARIAMPEAPSEVILNDPTTRQKYLESMQGYYEYRKRGYLYRSSVFDWQLLSSRIIFFVVLFLVACGIYFAWVQFRAALGALRRSPAKDGAPADRPSPLATQFEVSAKGIVINSSVLGVVILGLSLAFFYLYLVYVYPIQNVF
jgi:hypothetical protein